MKKSTETEVWITREGEVIPIVELETSHLLNILAMLKRNAEPVLEKAGLPVSSETLRGCYSLWDALEQEAVKRAEKMKVDPEDPDMVARFKLLELD